MSQHLAAIEAEVGEPLFIRTPRKMVPTEKGKELYTKIVPLIEKLEITTLELKNEVTSQTQAPLIKVGTPAEYFTKAALQKWKKLDVRLSVQFDIASNLLEKLSDNEVDLIITTQKQTVAGIEYKKIENECFVVVAPPDKHCDASTMKEIEEWLLDQTWISYGSELPIVRRYWREHFKKRPDIKLSHVIPDLRAVLEAIEHNMGISVLPEYLIHESLASKKTIIMFPHLSVENTIYAAYKTVNRDHPLLQKAVGALMVQ